MTVNNVKVQRLVAVAQATPFRERGNAARMPKATAKATANPINVEPISSTMPPPCAASLMSAMGRKRTLAASGKD